MRPQMTLFLIIHLPSVIIHYIRTDRRLTVSGGEGEQTRLGQSFQIANVKLPTEWL